MFVFLFLAVVDNRCYLENGGSAESFFVSEDVPVGTIIGRYNKVFLKFFFSIKLLKRIIHVLYLGMLKINGDSSENGNINLSLKEVDSPVAILPGTKELSLTKPLDKEVYSRLIINYKK